MITVTPKFTTRVSDVMLAEIPRDGGKWVLYCDHKDEATGEWLNAGMIQDTNRKRLAEWASVKRGEGYTEWCPECQEAHAEEAN